MDRVKRATTATISNTWYSDGTVTDPGTVTIGITRADGTVVVAPGTATSGGGAAARTFNLTTTHTALLDTLTATWTSSALGTDTTTHEVVGDFLFNVNEFRALGSAYANVTNYPTTAITAIRSTVEQALEDACARAFVPRYTLETLSGTGTTELMLKWPDVRSIRSITIDDVVGTAADVAFRPFGLAYLAAGWTAGYGNVTVGYEHGMPFPPERISRAALLLAKRWLTPASMDDRAINVTNDSGTYAIMQAGVRGHLFDLPEVVAAVDQYNLSVGVA